MSAKTKRPFSRRAAMGLALAALPGAALAAPATLRGTVSWRERIALPPGAILEVGLVDVSLADAPARVIARTRILAGRGGSVRYRLRYETARIRPRRSYALQARISHRGRLLFITATRHSIFDGGSENTDITVERVRDESGPSPAATPAGRWLAEDIRGGGVIDRLQLVIEIAADGAVSGSGGCNRIAGRADIAGPSISFGRLVSTRMACAPAAMNQEQKFLAALNEVRRWRIDPARRKLILSDARGATILILAEM